MILSTVKKLLSATIRLSSRIGAKLVPSATHFVRKSRTIEARKVPEGNIVDIPTHMEWMFIGETILPEQVIYEFKDVAVSWNGIVIKGFQLFIQSLAYFTYEEEYSGVFLLRQLIARKKKIKGTVGLIYDNWSVSNYYHWLADTLPRLLVLREKYPDCTLLVPAPIPQYVSLSTAALGFHNILPLEKEAFIQVQHLVMPSHIAHPGRQDPFLIQNVSKELLEAFGYSADMLPSVSMKRIYVSRSRQKVRRLFNEKEILPLLISYGFEIMYFEEMDFEQQVKAMQSAAVVIGVHGANLTNVLFMRAGAQVVELLNEQLPNSCYFQLASNLNLNYQVLPCKPILHSKSVNDNDVVVDICQLNKILDSL
ncbi:MAG: glycosyltransferase family 61 protein [Hymenobacter sp.]|nr:MAG: glycosyltransferase family 61 protein [Hymenobacter sp.]